MESYRTVRRQAADEFVERRSRFIGAVCPVTTEQDAVAFINEKKKIHWDAAHNVYAYILRDGQIRRYSDDGEPQGTAGIPVLDVLQKAGLTDCAVVVTRYFGGVLLGAGGLVRAYAHAAGLAVRAGEPVEMRPCTVAAITADYPRYGMLERLIPAAGGVIEDTAFAAEVTVRFHIEDDRLDVLQKQLTEQSAGRLTVTKLDHTFAPFAVEA
ncbi:MAG: IMPACT family protein [Acutalibacteraceae bacterium]